MKKIISIPPLEIDAVEYASQGNAILGIRDSGKTFTAMYIGEQLMLNGIPILAIDPIGIWKNLRKGMPGKKGFPVVVAGGEEGDLPLTPESAPSIVQAAMKENISLVLDLYSMNLSKNDWKKIVASCIRLLLYENKSYGLRHIFLEEASEFCPQRIMPEQGVVYAEIEKLARMGGNASLGITLINQRAEEVNKAVLELCDCLFLHRQKGRHSLTALGKWLDVADTTNSREITKALPSMEQGECWVWTQGSHSPVRVKVPLKQTVHPDRRNPQVVTKSVSVDVSQFVKRMMRNLKEANTPVVKKPLAKLDVAKDSHETAVSFSTTKSTLSADQSTILNLHDQLENLQEQLTERAGQLRTANEALSAEKSLRITAEEKLTTIREMLQPQYLQLQKVFNTMPELVITGTSVEMGRYTIWLGQFTGKHRKLLELLIEHKKIDRRKLAVLSGIPYTSGYLDKGLLKMKQLKLISKEGNDYILLPL